MKTTNLILITLLGALPALLHAQDQGASPDQPKSKATKWNSLPPLERARVFSGIKGSRKIQLKPEKQSDGIETGCIMAYGHIIPPPYRVQHVDNRLVVNGVQILPSLVAQREHKPVKITKEKRNAIKQAMQLEREIRQLFWRETDNKALSPEAVRTKISLFAKSNEMVADANWDGETILRLVYKNREVGSVLLQLNPGIPRQSEKGSSSDSDSARVKKVQTDDANRIKRLLSRGAFYVLVDGLQETHGDIVPRVMSVMDNNALSDAERFERLTTVFHPEAALYVMENYIASEWENSKCIINPNYPHEWPEKERKGK